MIETHPRKFRVLTNSAPKSNYNHLVIPIISSNSENKTKLIRFSGPPQGYFVHPPVSSANLPTGCALILGAIVLGFFTVILIVVLQTDKNWWRYSYSWFWIVVISQLWGVIGYYSYRSIKNYRDQERLKQAVHEELGLVKPEIKRDKYQEIFGNVRPDERTASRSPPISEAARSYERITSEIQENLEKPPSNIPIRICPFCGAENEATARSCTNCKVWLPPTKVKGLFE